jgi:nucleoside-diphosphate-sugar epimerase
MRVLLIGGTEFISLHLVRALLRDGHRVAVLNRGRNPARLPAGVRTIVCDRTDHAALRRARYDCHAVYTTTKIRAELGIRPRYSLAAGLAQTYEWYVREGLDRRDVDFSAEDAHLR